MLKNIRLSLVLLVLCGIAYPLLMTGVAQVIMPEKADGSLIKTESGKIIGSELIGQSFKDPAYFHGRVSSIEYDAAGSGSPNYAPSNQDMVKRTEKDLTTFLKENPTVKQEEIPADLLTNSGSGLDPNISPEGAEVQVSRIALERGVSQKRIYNLVEKHTESRSLGLFGEPKVNVLKLNMALDQLK
ncbi:potassium-transporting ATPase subunit KdpC [Peribacillus muralis]|uniref:potassium-transporting ATPase subunit KdpC n=1 Tax=Peribacillus muralis TaxID=264697 RepID=UPI001F4E05EC|nr:potassium-transporting ATPase subunit KdpC [Peribacillus muralis]MCK1993829.1 potassium-transporting ATPase subunit KdpC [Peribacillus muralis]MCK2013882.1 potassium-transporting ATPase subunit KdpC [Peribacillus muralis]